MSDAERDDRELYKVVVNDEEQYSIWPVGRSNPAGWMDAGATGPREACLDFIECTWTDMRPRTLRRRMEGSAATAGHPG